MKRTHLKTMQRVNMVRQNDAVLANHHAPIAVEAANHTVSDVAGAAARTPTPPTVSTKELQ